MVVKIHRKKSELAAKKVNRVVALSTCKANSYDGFVKLGGTTCIRPIVEKL